MNSKVMYAIIAVVIVGIIGTVMFSNQSSAPVVEESPNGQMEADSNTQMEGTGEGMMEQADTMAINYTLSDVAEHSTPEDCWMAIEGKVYDVTGYIEQGIHPGGEAIVQGCGKDATEMFNDRDGNGDAHSARARSFLENYYIGELTQ